MGAPLVYDVFLSHAAEDDELAARTAALLKESGIEVFTTGPGFPTGIWADEVRAALEESEYFWLLLTDHALDRSVYVHHEFGYFFGYHRNNNPSVDIRDIGKRLRYMLRLGNDQRPGMYQHFQDYRVDLDDPVSIARIIATDIGNEFKEPPNPKELRIAGSSSVLVPPNGIEAMEVIGTGSQAGPNYSYGIRTLRLVSPQTIFKVSAAAWHPQVDVSLMKDLPQIGPNRQGEPSLKVEWASSTEPPGELQDSYGRKFAFQRPRDPGPPWQPLYVTFETLSEEAWAAVAYMRVERQQHGHPETHMLHGPSPYGWVRGQRSED